MQWRKISTRAAGVLIALFGLLTLFLSGSVIFDLFGIRAKEGNYVLFIVWANFLSSILYLFSAYGFFKMKKWTLVPLLISSIILIIAFAGLLIHINSDGIYETKTTGAMIFRISFTLVFTSLAYYLISKPQKIKTVS